MTAAEIRRVMRRLSVLDPSDPREREHVWLWGEPMTEQSLAAARERLRRQLECAAGDQLDGRRHKDAPWAREDER